MPTEFTLGDHTYRTKRMPAMRQFHVARKLAPVVTSLGIFGSLGTLTGITEKLKNPLELVAMAKPVVAVLAAMPEAECEYIIGSCMASCQRKQGDAWAEVWSEGAGMPMFADITMPEMLQITFEVLQDALGAFWEGTTPTSGAV